MDMIPQHRLRHRQGRFGRSEAHCACGAQSPATTPEGVSDWYREHLALIASPVPATRAAVGVGITAAQCIAYAAAEAADGDPDCTTGQPAKCDCNYPFGPHEEICAYRRSLATAPAAPVDARPCHGCGYTLVRCYDCKRGGALACCPDCDHSEQSTEPKAATVSFFMWCSHCGQKPCQCED